MTTIVAFAVPDASSGRAALDRLAGLVDDTALVFRDRHGAVRVHQTSELGAPADPGGHGLLGVAVALATAGSLGLGTADQWLALARGDLLDAGLDVGGLEVGAEQVAAGAAAAFLAAGDDTAVAIESALRTAGYDDVRRVHVPAAAVEVWRSTQHLE